MNKDARKPITAAVHNLGCKVNAYESEAMRALLEKEGFTIVPFSSRADVYVVNTCTVTNTADQKSRQMLHRARAKNPAAIVAAVGCYVQTHADSLADDPAVDLLIGTNEKHRLPEMIRARLAEPDAPAEALSDLSHPVEYEELCTGVIPHRTRAFLKIQDGCDQFCSYCAIPLARGRIRSRDGGEIVREASRLVESGLKEIVLTGIHVSSYGRDLGQDSGQALAELIRDLDELPGLERIRLSSLEPGIMTEDVVRSLAKIPSVCPHFHLSLQSGCDATLQRMNRHYTGEEYVQACARIREHFEDPTFTTDVIVGFPGESEDEFEDSCRLIKRIGFYRLHVFKYSRRDGTRAAAMKGQISETVKQERSRRLLALSRQGQLAFEKALIGREEEVLIEERTQEGWTGHTRGYVKVLAEGDDHEPNQTVRGIVCKNGKDRLIISC